MEYNPLTLDNLQAVQRDLGEELVLVGVQRCGHGSRADAAVGLADSAASFLDARKDEQIIEQEEAAILARPLTRRHGNQVEEQELPFRRYQIGNAFDDALQFPKGRLALTVLHDLAFLAINVNQNIVDQLEHVLQVLRVRMIVIRVLDQSLEQQLVAGNKQGYGY